MGKDKKYEIDFSKLWRSPAKTKSPVWFEPSREEMEERMARQWERNERILEEKRLSDKCLL
ncbi:hypothetical protein LI063_05850 [Clostridium perfringens]|uniref:hypothetical protein n=1 Tax=Clostridium perfringens TaxID=1502 RepID=UPI002247BC7B|nr:hypothetical protein [Clostridium perfringens]MCX0363682.1 hypothetical protein [Clostridium perfringens]MDU1475280.1 hypothetical protein [Clostridium perfringens]